MPAHPFRRTVASVDWGFTGPGVLQAWGVDGDGRMYLIREHYQTQRLIGWWVERAKQLQSAHSISAFACDPAEPMFIEEFRRAGLNAIPAFNDIRRGIQAVMERLKVAGDGRPRLYLLDDALIDRDESLVTSRKPASTAEEFEAYIWPKGQDGKSVKEVPVDDNNHGLDALRYAVAYVDKLGPQVDRSATMISSPLGRPRSRR